MMVNTKYDGVLKELAALLVPHLIAHPDMTQFFASTVYVDTKIDILSQFDQTHLEDLIKEKMDELGPIDKILVREVCEEVIDAADFESVISDYLTNNFDISDWQTEIKEMVDLDDALDDRLPDAVQTVIQGLSFTVEVSTR